MTGNKINRKQTEFGRALAGEHFLTGNNGDESSCCFVAVHMFVNDLLDLLRLNTMLFL